MQQFLMNALSGSVDTLDNWAAEMYTWSDDPAECQRQFNRLIEVVRDENGDWVEAGQYHPRPHGADLQDHHLFT